MKTYRPCVRSQAFGLLQISRKLEIKLEIKICITFFSHFRIPFNKFSFCSKFHVSIITDSGVTTNFVHKGFD